MGNRRINVFRLPNHPIITKKIKSLNFKSYNLKFIVITHNLPNC